MNKRQKTKIISLSFITLGFYYFFLNKKASKLAKEDVQSLNSSTTLNYAIEDFLGAIGGKDNIKEINASTNKIKFLLIDPKISSMEKLKSLGIKNIFLNGLEMTMIVPTHGLAIEKAIQAYAV